MRSCFEHLAEEKTIQREFVKTTDGPLQSRKQYYGIWNQKIPHKDVWLRIV